MTAAARSSRPRKRVAFAAVAAATLWLCARGVAAPAGPAAATPSHPLADRHAAWLEEVDVILSVQERDAFLALPRDYQRDAFIERFWRERDPDPYTARNEFHDRWQEKVDAVRQLFTSLREERSRYWLLHGDPDPRFLIFCKRREPQIELWFYPRGSDLEHRPFPLFFYHPYGAVRDVRLWDPQDGQEALTGACEPGSLSIDEQDALGAAFKLMEEWTGIQYEVLLAKARDRPPSPDREWVAVFQSQSTDTPTGSTEVPADLAVAFGGHRQSRVEVEGTLRVPAPSEVHHFLLNGDVVLDDKLFERFRVQYSPPPNPQPAATTLPLAFVRALRPGRYTLVLRLEDVEGAKFYRVERAIDVPAFAPPSEGDPAAPEEAGEPAIHLLAPKGVVQGHVRFDVEVDGGTIAAIEWRIDGKPLLRRRAAPWSVELDLGPAARIRKIEAVAFDAKGNELVRDERLVNAGEYRFAVHLRLPSGNPLQKPGPRRARAELAIPAGAAVDRLELYLDEARIGTIYNEPWELAFNPPADQSLHVLRAVAVLADGSTAEDSALLNAPEASANIDVRLVELFTRVMGKDGHAVHGLGCGDFKVSESGREQHLVRCEEAAEQTLHLGVLLDVSASMEPRLADSEHAADLFLAALLRPRDRATLVSFNDFTNRLVPFTRDLETLRTGLRGLKAERGTALWDAVIQTLQDFGGVGGRRALLLLTDGEDHSSNATFEEAEAMARQSGVVLYAVGLDLPFGEPRRRLRRLAEQTGGRAFYLKSSAGLAGIYAQIADELRSEYLLVYQSDGTGEAFRAVKVEGRRKGLEIEAPAGYQP